MNTGNLQRPYQHFSIFDNEKAAVECVIDNKDKARIFKARELSLITSAKDKSFDEKLDEATKVTDDEFKTRIRDLTGTNAMLREQLAIVSSDKQRAWNGDIDYWEATIKNLERLSADYKQSANVQAFANKLITELRTKIQEYYLDRKIP